MKRVRQTLWSYLLLTLACGVYAVSFNWCYSPSRIGFGGITGVGQIVNALLPWAPIGGVAAAGGTSAGVLPVRHGPLVGAD